MKTASEDGKVAKHTVSVELLHHFNCGQCRRWWSVGDYKGPHRLHCPHCGHLAEFEVPATADATYFTS